MPKKDNLSGERNFLITMSKQTAGSDGFMPSGHRFPHRKFWYIVIGVIVVIVLFIFGNNMLASHQSKNPPTHHTKVTRVAKKHKAKKHSDKAEKAKKAKEAAKKAKAKKAAAAKRRKARAKKRAKALAREHHEAARHQSRANTYTGHTSVSRVRTTPTRTVSRTTPVAHSNAKPAAPAPSTGSTAKATAPSTK